jgi:fatty acid desaturase
MFKPEIPDDNRILAQQRRASKEITKGLEKKIDELHKLNNFERIKEFLFFVLVYGLGFLFIFLSTKVFIFFFVGILLMGISLNSLGIFIHEGLHGLLARNERINHIMTFLVGIPILLSATAYQTTHNDHHYELGRKLDFGTYQQHMKNPRFVWFAYFAQLFFGSILYVLFIPFFGFKSAKLHSRIEIVIEYVLIVSLFIFAITVIPGNFLLTYWVYPLIILNFLSNVRGLASHALGDVENIYLSSRTIFCSRFMSLLFMNENYHLEHHLFPCVPSYNLGKMNKLIWKRLPKALRSESYVDFLKLFFRAAFTNNLKPQGVVKPNISKE